MKNDVDISKYKPWTVCDAKVNVAALLNDPRKVRRDHDLFTKTWGDSFTELATGSVLPKSERVPKVSQVDFLNYIYQNNDKFLRHQSQYFIDHQNGQPRKGVSEFLFAKSNRAMKKTLDSSNDIGAKDQKIIQAATRQALDSVPRLFLRIDFALEDQNIFMSVLNFHDKKQAHKINVREISSSKLLQEKLSHYLDLVEVAIVRQISVRSEAFFEAMTSHDDLNDYLRKMSSNIHQLRVKVALTGGTISSKSLQIVHLHSKRRRNLLLLEKLQTMITVHQAQPTIQLLLSTNEYAGALDLIQTTQEVLKQEMAGLHCFRHLSSQLSEIEHVISQMMKEELSQCIQVDLQRPLAEGSSTVNPHHLNAIALGLLRRRQLIFIAEFREEVKQAIKSIIKMTVMEVVDIDQEYVASEQNSETVLVDGDSDRENEEISATKKKSLAERMRLLDYDHWIQLLNEIFENLNIFLRRVRSFLSLIVDVICMSCPLWVKDNVQGLNKLGMPQGRPDMKKIIPSGDGQIDALQTREDGNVNELGDYDDVLDDMDQYEERLMELVNYDDHKLILDRTKFTKANSRPCGNPDEITDPVEGASANSDMLLTDVEHDDMMQSICESLAWTADFAQDRCVKVIIAKNKNYSLDKLTSSQFLCLAQSIEKYLTDTETIVFDYKHSSNDSRYFAEYFNACYGNSMRGSSVLRGVLQSRASQFINRFHEERKTKLSLILNNESWKQADVPAELSRMLQNLSACIIKDSVTETSIKLDESAISSALYLDGIDFTVVGTVLLLLKMVMEYLRCADDLPTSTSDFIVRVAELLTLFNSRTCQLVLGAGALEIAGLKTISTKNLGLASRCLQLVLYLLPSIKHLFEEKLVQYCPPLTLSQQRKSLKQFDHVKKAYEVHIAEIDGKLVNIMDSAFDNNLSKWQVKAPTPSKEFRTICRQMLKFHENIESLLPKEHVMSIFRRMHTQFKKRLQQKLQQCAVHNDGGPQSGLVMSDVAFYEDNLKSLKMFSEGDITMESIWS